MNTDAVSQHGDDLRNDIHPPVIGDASPAEGASPYVATGRRRRRHGSGRRGDRKGFGGSSSARKNHHSKGRSRVSPRERGERWTVIACALLGAVLCVSVGYYFGQKHNSHDESAKEVVQRDVVFPSPEADALLDVAFKAFHEGNYRDALLDFQKVQELQPALVGIDFLIAEAAYKSGEQALAEEAAGRSLSKSESVDQARLLLVLINLAKAKTAGQDTLQMADPLVAAKNEVTQLAASHPGDAKTYAFWGDLLRREGEYRSAVDILHKGVIRTDPIQTSEILSAKEHLARLQNEPAKSVPSLSEMTSMSGEQALVAAFAALQLKQWEEAASFFERSKGLYAPPVFRELMNDVAFADYRSIPQVKVFFKSAGQ